jgi:hypothetical protein
MDGKTARVTPLKYLDKKEREPSPLQSKLPDL